MRTLVTGNKGYIGTHLNRAGCDLKDGIDFSDLVGNSYDVVIHLAAYVSVTESQEKPDLYMENNCIKLAKFLANNKVGRLIFTSTGGALYGNKHSAKEEDACWLNCLSPYAQSKYLAERIIEKMHNNYAILRLANVWGGNTELRGEANVQMHFSKDNPIIVYGGDQTRDFIHVNDVCRVIEIAASQSMIGIYNIGSGSEVKIIDIAKSISYERKVPIQIVSKRVGEIDFVSLDITKAESIGLLERSKTVDV